MIRKLKQVLISGVIVGFVIESVDIVFNWLIQFIWPYNVLELGGMRTLDDPVMFLFFVYPWVLGFALAYVFLYFEKTLEGDYIVKGLKFGFLMWVVISIPTAFLMFSSMNYPIGFTINSVVPPLVYMILSGIAIAKAYDWLK